MDIQVVIVLLVIFVTRMEAASNDEENLILPRQMDTCAANSRIKCSSDCSSLLVCYDDTSLPFRLQCPEGKPYCLNGKCGTTNKNCRINTNSNAISSFECTSDGNFPDPTDCTKSYSCNGAVIEHNSCEPGFIYNSKVNRCHRGTPRTDHASAKICQKISCENKPTGFILFPANPAFYAYCDNDGTFQTMTMYKCEDIESQVFDISKKECVFKCKSAGYFKDPLDCKSYYLCEGWINFKYTKLSCPGTQYFDGTGCVNGLNCGVTTEPTTTPYEGPDIETDPPSTEPPQGPPIEPDPDTPPISSDQLVVHVTKTTRSPFYPLWKHNGKYSIRLVKP